MANRNLRKEMVDQVREEQQQRARAPREPRVHRAPAVLRARADTDGHGETGAEASAPGAPQRHVADFQPGDGTDNPPRKRRRRRRTGAAKGAGSAGVGGGDTGS